jgi:transposase-like protein
MTSLNWEVLIIDCTYKTNKYGMPLCIIFGVTALNTTFYVAFAFISSEHSDSYMWILERILELYQELNIPNPIFIATDCEVGLINAISCVFPSAQHALCTWHVNKNVLKNCRPSFDDHES